MNAPGGGNAVTPPGILTFIAKARATGALLESEAERRAAQGVLNYWSAELIRADRADERAWTPTMLAPFERSEREAAASSAEPVGRDRDSWERVRLGALARQWQESGKSDGYLLHGDALARAASLAEGDPDIDELVDASRSNEARKARFRRRALSAITFVLLVGLAVASLVLYDLWSDAAAAWKEADGANRELKAKNESLTRSLLAADAEAETKQADAAALDECRAKLDEAVGAVSRGVDQGALEERELPKSLQAAIPPREPVPPELPGYDENFLGRSLPLPAFARGDMAYLPYAHHGVWLDTELRIARMAACNVDRSSARDLPSVVDRFVADPRVEKWQQPDAEAFKSDGIARCQLVTGRDIAWGAAFAGDEAEAVALAAGMVNVHPNTVPQDATFHRVAWLELAGWVERERGPRRAVFSGPVLRPSDRRSAGVPVPDGFWKIVVSSNDGPALVVDAFLVERSRIGPGPFTVESARVTVGTIESLTGLDFGDDVRRADDDARSVVALVERLNAPDPSDRSAAADQLLATLSADDSPARPERVARTATALAELAQDDALTPEGRASVLRVLSKTPREVWNTSRGLDLKASIRRFIHDFETTVQGDPDPATPEQPGELAELAAAVDYRREDAQTVFIQFAGMTREEVQAASLALGWLGWKVPDEERTADAATLNEVRYGSDEDVIAARTLAADLRALDLHDVRDVRKIDGLPKGRLEVWISR